MASGARSAVLQRSPLGEGGLRSETSDASRFLTNICDESTDPHPARNAPPSPGGRRTLFIDSLDVRGRGRARHLLKDSDPDTQAGSLCHFRPLEIQRIGSLAFPSIIRDESADPHPARNAPPSPGGRRTLFIDSLDSRGRGRPRQLLEDSESGYTGWKPMPVQTLVDSKNRVPHPLRKRAKIAAIAGVLRGLGCSIAWKM